MALHNFTDIAQVQQYYAERLIAMIKGIGGTPIIWQDPLDYGVEVSIYKSKRNNCSPCLNIRFIFDNKLGG